MNTKLTLSIEHEVIETAKDYAKKHGKSLSNIVEEYLKALSEKKSTKERVELSKIVKELKGSITFNELLQDALIEKYLR